ncbi:hypothetical protein HWV62_13948 [Athelia sp. TMB]|nr:hypothetical protein HWV62_13948 [Athelia sp. TMB]
MEAVVRAAVERHDQTIQDLAPALAATLSAHLSNVLAGQVEVFNFGAQISKQWSDLASNITSIHDSVAGLSTTSTALTHTLAQSHILSHSVLAAQQHTQEHVQEMVDLVQVEMLRINATAAEVVEDIHVRARGWGIGWGMLWGAESLPLVQFIRFLWWLLTRAAGAIMVPAK